jgi:hypothetical protein
MESPKRKHYPYVLTSDSPVPGGGDAKSWLEYYKLNPGAGETYVPHTHPGVRDAEEGDLLWFIFDEQLLGYASILRVAEDYVNAKFEVWYDAEDFTRYEGVLRIPPGSIITPLPPEIGEEWFASYMPWR